MGFKNRKKYAKNRLTFRQDAVKWLTLQKAAHNRKGKSCSKVAQLICLGLYESGWDFETFWIYLKYSTFTAVKRMQSYKLGL